MDFIFLDDHKTGHSLTSKIIKIIKNISNINIKLLTFYLFHNEYKINNKYVILIRNPKEIIISGYLYHKKCTEKWAIVKDGKYYEGNKYNWLKNHFTKRSIDINLKYIKKSNNFSKDVCYQDKLNKLSQTEGIIEELNGPAYLTITGMCNLKHFNYLKNNNIFLLRLEDLIFNHDNIMLELLSFLNINKNKIDKIINESKKHNILNLKKKNIILGHTTNKNITKNRYLKYWNNTIENEYNKQFGKYNNLIKKLNYI